MIGQGWLTTFFSVFGRPLQWWVVIAPWEQGILVRLGKVAATLAPGIHFRVPFLDRIYVQSVRRRTLISTNLTATTLDGKTITFTLATDFYISNIRKLFDSLSGPEATIGSRAASAATLFISTNERGAISPATIGTEATSAIETGDWGIAGVVCTVMTFSESRAYRIMSNDYQCGVGLFNLDDKEHCGLR